MLRVRRTMRARRRTRRRQPGCCPAGSRGRSRATPGWPSRPAPRRRPERWRRGRHRCRRGPRPAAAAGSPARFPRTRLSPKWWYADPSLGVGDVDRRPVVVAEGLPDRVVAVERDRIGERPCAVTARRTLSDRARTGTPACARRRRPARGRRTAPPRPARSGERSQPVDARVRPEVDQHDAAAQGGRRQRRRS